MQSAQHTLKDRFLSLPEKKRAVFLANLIQLMTIGGRTSYADTEQSGGYDRLRASNEVIHVASGQLSALLRNDPSRYPDDVFFDIVTERSRPAAERDLASAVKQALEGIDV